MAKSLVTAVGAGLALTALVGCEYPQAPIPEVKTAPVVTSLGKLYSVNTECQVCNPSISQDQTHYPGCLLFLNLGTINVNVPDSIKGQYSASIVEHDRLTVVDTTNTVRWFLMKSAIPDIQGEIQDPRWCANGNYIAFCGKTSASATSKVWDGYVVRMSDKAVLKFSLHGVTEESTPHVWVGGPSAAPPSDSGAVYGDGLVSRDSIWAFFGTDSVKIAYGEYVSGTILTAHFVDYSQDSIRPVVLAKPANRQNYRVESGHISPDGNWITYECYVTQDSVEAYAQRLVEGSVPQFVAKGTDPTWWYYNGRTYIIYAVAGLYSDQDLTQAKYSSGSVGTTQRQEVELAPSGPEYIQFSKVGDPLTILEYPFKGGLSPDGFFIGTGYEFAYIFHYN